MLTLQIGSEKSVMSSSNDDKDVKYILIDYISLIDLGITRETETLLSQATLYNLLILNRSFCLFCSY